METTKGTWYFAEQEGTLKFTCENQKDDFQTLQGY